MNSLPLPYDVLKVIRGDSSLTDEQKIQEAKDEREKIIIDSQIDSIANFSYKPNHDDLNHSLLDYDDILIEPFILSDIKSRKDINTLVKKIFPFSTLPLMTAPMDSVIDKDNINTFIDNLIIPVLPRGIDIEKLDSQAPFFQSLSLEQLKSVNLNGVDGVIQSKYICVDIANGHMTELLHHLRLFKQKFPEIFVMSGNIANPETLEAYIYAGIDAVRLGIGNGNLCLTTAHTAVGYPMASLIMECHKIRSITKSKILLVADGGTKSYSDIIKALALGADYVMVGSLFSKFKESAGKNFLFKKIEIKNKKVFQFLYKIGLHIYKQAYGMSTKVAQKRMGREELRTSEGVVRYYKIETTINQWVQNFKDYLRSTLSYCNINDVANIHKCKKNIISQNALKRFNK